jgi:hypothetical protein
VRGRIVHEPGDQDEPYYRDHRTDKKRCPPAEVADHQAADQRRDTEEDRVNGQKEADGGRADGSRHRGRQERQ